MNFSIETPPLRRVLNGRLNVLERDGEVDEEKIEVINPPELELVFRKLLSLHEEALVYGADGMTNTTNVIISVECIPELGSYP